MCPSFSPFINLILCFWKKTYVPRKMAFCSIMTISEREPQFTSTLMFIPFKDCALPRRDFLKIKMENHSFWWHKKKIIKTFRLKGGHLIFNCPAPLPLSVFCFVLGFLLWEAGVRTPARFHLISEQVPISVLLLVTVMYSSLHSLFVEHLLCAMHSSRILEFCSEQKWKRPALLAF